MSIDSTRGVAHRVLGSPVLPIQLLISALVLLLILGALIFHPESLLSPWFFAGFALVFSLAAAAAALPWERIQPEWRLALPLLDIVAIIAIRESVPQLTAGVLLVFPVIWLASSFSAGAVIAGLALTLGLFWGARLFRGTPFETSEFGGLLLLPIVLCFIAVWTFYAARRSDAQQALLGRHARLIESSLGAARRQQQLLNEVLNAVRFGVIAFDRDRKITFLNRAQRQSLADFGAPDDAVAHPVVYDSDRATPLAERERPLARALEGNDFNDIVTWVGEPGGRRAAYAASARSIYDASGEYDGGVVVFRDVTAELTAIRARDDLVGTISHELRSPLTSILGYLELAMDEPGLDPKTRRMIDIAHANSDRLLVLVTDLIRASNDSDLNIPLSMVPCDIAELAAQSIEAHELYAAEQDVVLEYEGLESAPALADPVRIRQVLDNLVTNAIKYNIEWGAVTVTVSRDARSVSVAVQDTGTGMSETELPLIFDRFFRTSSAHASAEIGSGLGLNITRDIVQRHGGELSVTSRRGIGSTFTMTIPTRPEVT